jgi:hypothetical protein
MIQKYKVATILLFSIFIYCEKSTVIQCSSPKETIAKIVGFTMVYGLYNENDSKKQEIKNMFNRTLPIPLGFTDSTLFDSIMKKTNYAFLDSIKKTNNITPFFETWAISSLKDISIQNKDAILFAWAKTALLDGTINNNEKYVLKILIKSMNYPMKRWIPFSKKIIKAYPYLIHFNNSTKL